MIELLPIHGWAFDKGMWAALEENMPATIHLLAWNRGYYGKPVSHSFSTNAKKKIVVTHSFGLHLIDQAMIDQADMLIIISGFIEFHPGTPQFRKRSRAIVQQMIRQMHKKPNEVLDAFYTNCYAPEPVQYKPEGPFNVDLLIEDLGKLHQQQFEISRLKNISQICILHGTGDNIVRHIKGRELYDRLGSRATYYEIKQAPHGLPVTHTNTCWDFIRPEILKHNRADK